MYSLHPELLLDSINGFKFDQTLNPVSLNQNGYNDPKSNRPNSSELTLSSSSDSDGESSRSNFNGDYSSTMYKFISDMLMEEDLDTKPCMYQNCLALQAAERSFYDVLGRKYPPSPDGTLSPPCSDLTGESSNDSNDSYANEMVDSFFAPDCVQSENTILGLESYEKGSVFPAEGDYYAAKEWIFDASIVSKGRKLDQRDYVEEGRSNKLSAPSLTESRDSESDFFDEVLLAKIGNLGSIQFPVYRDSETLRQSKVSNGSRAMVVKKKNGRVRDLVDLPTLLNQCAQAIAGSDQRMANELLRQIRQHSLPFGDATQRTAYYFANALEARLAGVQTPVHTPVVSYKTSAADIIKAYKVLVSVCPFRILSNALANRTIQKITETATRVHIIDFGILYGFQWPCFIERISKRPGVPPKLHITGIDFPLPGFRPAERVEETGQRLKRYCERFNVPFEYTAIAQRWDTIKLEDLKVDREEFTVVSCLYRLKNLPDDTTVLKSPRDGVLRLIKKINPRLFVHGVVNGAFNGPFFTTRFREALFHYSTKFDIYDVNLPKEDDERLVLEREMLGREIMNIIACEGSERTERPETYKQWHARNRRIGFKQLPLDRDIMREIRKVYKSKYHDDYLLDEDGDWMLQGWKGRIVQGLSMWKPIQDKY